MQANFTLAATSELLNNDGSSTSTLPRGPLHRAQIAARNHPRIMPS